MNPELPQKELLIAIIEKDDAILMRKKPEGSPPYKETWYLFGCERNSQKEDSTTLSDYLKTDVGIDVDVINEPVHFDTETKLDHDGIEKFFIYITLRCKYLDGTPLLPPGAEKVSWITRGEFASLDLVPPSVKLLRGLGYLDK